MPLDGAARMHGAIVRKRMGSFANTDIAGRRRGGAAEHAPSSHFASIAMQVPPPTSPAATPATHPNTDASRATPDARDEQRVRSRPQSPVLQLPTELQTAPNAAFQAVPQPRQGPLSDRLADSALPLSELRAAFDDAFRADWVDPDSAAGELLAELATRRRDEPDAESQAAIQLHRMLFTALQARLPDDEATELRQLGGLYVENLALGRLPEVGYRLRMGALVRRFLAIAEQGPGRDGALLPPRPPWQARGAELGPHERMAARAVRHVGDVFAERGELGPADVPDIYGLRQTEFPVGPVGEREFQRYVRRAEAIFDRFATAMSLPTACRDQAMSFIVERAIMPAPVVQQAIQDLRHA